MPRASSRHPPGKGRGAIVKRSQNETAAKSKRRRTGDQPPSTQDASSFATTPPLSDTEHDHEDHSDSQEKPMSLGSQSNSRISPQLGSQGGLIGERKSFDWVTAQNAKAWKGWHQVHIVPNRRVSNDGRIEDVYPDSEGWPNTVGKFWSLKKTSEGRKQLISLLKFYGFDGYKTWHEPEYPEELVSVRTRPFLTLEAAAQTFPERAHECLALILHLDFSRISEAVENRRTSKGTLGSAFAPRITQDSMVTPSSRSPTDKKRRHEDVQCSRLSPLKDAEVAGGDLSSQVVDDGDGPRVMSNMSMLNLQLERLEWQEMRNKEKRTKALSKLKDHLNNFSPPSRPLQSSQKRAQQKRDSRAKQGMADDVLPPSSQKNLFQAPIGEEIGVTDEGISHATTMLGKNTTMGDSKSLMDMSIPNDPDDGDDEGALDDEVGGTQLLTDELPSQPSQKVYNNPEMMMQIEQQRASQQAGLGLGLGGLDSSPLMAAGFGTQVQGDGGDPMNISQRYNRYRAKDYEEEVYESESTDADEEIICPKA